MRILCTSGTILPPPLLLTTTTVAAAAAAAVVVVVVVVVVVTAVMGHLYSVCPAGDEELKERVVIPERSTNLCETECQQLRCDK